MNNDKKRTLILLAILAIVIAAVIIILSNKPADPQTGTSDVPAAAETVKDAWKQTGRTDRPSAVGRITYKNAASLTSAVPVPDAAAALVPMYGTVYVFAPVMDSEDPFEGLTAVFMSSKGDVISVISYSEMMRISDAAGQDPAYIGAANYVLSLYTTAKQSGAAADGGWYKLTAGEIDDMMK